MDSNRVLMPSLTWAYCHAASSFQRCTEMALLVLVSSLFGDSPGRLSLLCDNSWLAYSGLSSSFPNFPYSWHRSSLIQACPNHVKNLRNPGPSSSLESDLQMVSIHTLLHFFPAPQMPSRYEDWSGITHPPLPLAGNGAGRASTEHYVQLLKSRFRAEFHPATELIRGKLREHLLNT